MKNKPLAPLVPVLLVALGLLIAPLASAATSPSVHAGVVHACMKAKGKPSQRGMIRIVGPTQKCKAKRGWKPLNWNLSGPPGATGDTGPQGAPGAMGADGSNGPEGKQGAKGSDATVENQLKEVIASQGKEIEKLTGEVSSLTAGLLSLTSNVQGFEGTLNSTATQVTALAGKVAGQCTALNEVTSQANKLTTGVSELTGALNLVLGGFLPKLPEASKGVTC